MHTIHTHTYVCLFPVHTYADMKSVFSVVKEPSSSGFWGSIFSRSRAQQKQEPNCEDSIRRRTKPTIQMLTAHFGFIKLSFDYAIMFSIALGFVLVLDQDTSNCHSSAGTGRRCLYLMAHPAEV